jgi:cation:H+ antiporter
LLTLDEHLIKDSVIKINKTKKNYAMLISLVYIFISLLLLYFGANWLVKGSSALALKAGISPLVAGLTVVAFGTSSPELVVGINTALAGQGNITIGNVIGSNLFNICVILGISAMVAPLKIKMQLLKIDIPILILVTTGFMLLFIDRHISRFEGIILVTGIVVYTVVNIYLARREKNIEVLDEFEKSVPKSNVKWYISAGLVLAGIGTLVAGSEFLVKGAVDIARSLGVGETIIGITIIAAGTSLPELASSIVATIRKEYDIAIGNIVGSNIFNLLGIVGISSLAKPLSAIAISNIDLYVMIGVTLLLLPFFRTHYTLKRDEGFFMIAIYGIYMYYLWPK